MSRKYVISFMLIIALALFGCNLTNTVALPAPATVTGVPTVVDTAAATPADTAAATPAETAAATPAETATNTPVNTAVPTATLPAATATLAPSATAAPAPTNTTAPVNNPAASSKYIDDRSTPTQVIVSLYNAINRQEYLRAYNYWTNPSGSLGSFTAYAAGYQGTAAVTVVFGQVFGDAGMSQYRGRR